MNTATEDTAAGASVFLDWGSSVNINEDLRRTIQSEITVIDSDIRTLDTSIKTEQKTASQLTRDFSHAQAELIRLSRGAEEERSNAFMNEEILGRMSAEVDSTTVMVVTPNKNNDSGDNGDDDNVNGNGNGSAANSDEDMDCIANITSSNSEDRTTMSEDVMQRRRQLRSLTSTLTSKKIKVDECQSKLLSLQYDLDSVNHNIKRDQQNQSSWNSNVNSKRKEHDKCSRDIKISKDKLHKSRKLLGSYTQQHTNELKTLSSLKEQHRHEEELRKVEAATLETRMKTLQNQIASVETSTCEMTNHITRFQEQFAQRESMVQEHKVMEQERTQVQEQSKMLQTREEELKALLAEKQKEVKLNTDILTQVQSTKKALTERQHFYNVKENDAVHKAREEMPKILQQGETLSRAIATMQETARIAKEKMENEQALHQSKLVDLHHQVLQKNNITEEQRGRIATIQKERDESNELIANEIEQHQSLQKNFEDAKGAQDDIVTALLQEREKEAMEREMELVSEQTKLEKLARGKGMYDESKVEEKELSEKVANIQLEIISLGAWSMCELTKIWNWGEGSYIGTRKDDLNAVLHYVDRESSYLFSADAGVSSWARWR